MKFSVVNGFFFVSSVANIILLRHPFEAPIDYFAIFLPDLGPLAGNYNCKKVALVVL